MNRRILFVASLHHPETLQSERSMAQQSGTTPPLFPTSTALHFWEKALRKRGYILDVFWRNISGFVSQDISKVKAEKFSNRITPRKVAQALLHRLPYDLNLDLRERNKKLLDYARKFQPTHIWLIGDNRTIHADTLATIKDELGCKLLYSTGTSPIVFSHQIEREAAPLYDLVISNDFYHGIQWRELGAKQMICLPVVAIDPDFHYPRPKNTKLAADIAFVGTLLPENLYSERVDALQALSDFDLGIWSVHDLPPQLKSYGRGAALGASMLDVLSSAKISLNVHGNFMRYGGNMRLFEAASIGTFQLVDNRPAVAEWFTIDEHLVVYDDWQDLQDKAHYYLAHDDERQKIAEAAHQYVINNHTYDNRLQNLETQLEENNL
ncbi:MAG: glycosyltransferase [Phototrophicaceae bacterium]